MKKGYLEMGEKPSEAKLKQVLPQLPSELPQSYLTFLEKHDGASGDLPVQPFYFQLWGTDEIINNNEGYEIKNYLPDYFGIGGNGGGELLALYLKNQKIFSIPFIPMAEEYASLVAKDFENFIKIMGMTHRLQTEDRNLE